MSSSPNANEDSLCRVVDIRYVCHALSPHVDMEWRFGGWGTISGVRLVTCPWSKITGSVANNPHVNLQRDV
ncbi:hypothetical protein TNCV_2541651 [Trichonephila clavipes]|nr:hypothetical protein TNCV_2541651 [Trichonephila clavipes]